MIPKKLNRRATTIFGYLLNLLGEQNSVIVDNTGKTFMPVHFEKLYNTVMMGYSGTVYSMTHYYEQGGDLIPDPDMSFFVVKWQISESENLLYIYPMTYQDSYIFQETLYSLNSKTMMNRQQHDITTFANKWLNNIYYQQKLNSQQTPKL